MRLLRAFMLNITPVLADITVFSCIFALLSSPRDEGMLQIPLVAFVICAAAISLLNCILARWERTIHQIVLANLAMVALNEGVLLSALGNTSSPFIYAACALLFIYPALRSLYLIRRPPTTNTMLAYSQAAFFGIGCYLLLQYNEYFRPGWGLTALCLVSQAMNLSLLLYLRYEERRSRITNTSGPERWLILAFRAGLMLVLAAILAFFMLSETREMLMRILNYIINTFLWILDLLIRLLDYILSLLFYSHVYEDLPYGGGGGLFRSVSISQKEFETNYILMALFWLLCAAMLRWMLKLIKARLRHFTSSNVQQKKEASPFFWSYVRKIIMNFGNLIRFYSLLLFHFRQPAGVFARLERKGRFYGCPRLPGQTPREFLEMISSRTIPEEVDTRVALSDLAEQLDALCFQTDRNETITLHSPYKALPTRKVNAMFRVLRRNMDY